LPLTVAPVFHQWLEQHHPDRLARIESLIRSTRGGKLNSSEFGRRMRGTGEIAQQIRQVFKLFQKKHGLDRDLPGYDCTHFRRPELPEPASDQMRLF